MPAKKKPPQVEVTEQLDWVPKPQPKEQVADLRMLLDKIKARDGVIGYILRGTTSAAVDIKDPSKIIDYAVLSTSVLECAESLSETFGLGALKNVVLEGNDLKVLLVTIGEHRVSVFMEKSVDHGSIYRELT